MEYGEILWVSTRGDDFFILLDDLKVRPLQDKIRELKSLKSGDSSSWNQFAQFVTNPEFHFYQIEFVLKKAKCSLFPF